MPIQLDPSANGGPLLAYALQLQPDPLQVGQPAWLNLVVSNGGDERVTCKSIQLSFPVGSDGTDLASDGTISVKVPDGWVARVGVGVVKLAAPGDGVEIADASLVFEIGVTANVRPGTATVTLTETAFDEYDCSEPRSGTFTVNKFPAHFSLSDLTAVPLDAVDIPYGEPAHLNWTATGAGVSCWLEYQPADDETSKVRVQVPTTGPYKTEKLTRAKSVTFTLTAEVSVLGQDNPRILQRQLTVTVRTLSLHFIVEPQRVAPNGLVQLTWHAANAETCFLDDEPQEAIGVAYRLMTQDHTFTMRATGCGGKELEQVDVVVDRNITPTETGFVLLGQEGSPGKSGIYIESAVPGGKGGDAVLDIVIPPLDTSNSPSRVIPITVQGGYGGDGISNWDAWGIMTRTGIGGDGGNAVLTATFDPSQPPPAPAQYIVNVLGGFGGRGYRRGPNGKRGTASATIDGQPLPLP